MHPIVIFARLYRCRRGAAAVEMMLVTPLLTALLFGAIELGRYFLHEHRLLSAVRDGARFAARQNFTAMPCNGPPAPEKAAQIRNLVRFGNIAGTGNPRIPYWAENATITLVLTCTPGPWSGLYDAHPQGAPVVTVSAAIPYVPLLGALGLGPMALQVRAQAQSAVTGL